MRALGGLRLSWQICLKSKEYSSQLHMDAKSNLGSSQESSPTKKSAIPAPFKKKQQLPEMPPPRNRLGGWFEHVVSQKRFSPMAFRTLVYDHLLPLPAKKPTRLWHDDIQAICSL